MVNFSFSSFLKITKLSQDCCIMCLFVCPLGLHKAAISSVFVHPVVVSERPNAAALTGSAGCALSQLSS